MKLGTGSSCCAIGIGDADNLNKDHMTAAVRLVCVATVFVKSANI